MTKFCCKSHIKTQFGKCRRGKLIPALQILTQSLRSLLFFLLFFFFYCNHYNFNFVSYLNARHLKWVLEYIHKFFDTPFFKKWSLIFFSLVVGWTQWFTFNKSNVVEMTCDFQNQVTKGTACSLSRIQLPCHKDSQATL